MNADLNGFHGSIAFDLMHRIHRNVATTKAPRHKDIAHEAITSRSCWAWDRRAPARHWVVVGTWCVVGGSDGTREAGLLSTSARPGGYTFRVIRIEGLTKRYPESERDVLAGIDLEVAEGDFVSLVGRSGCGKTTLLNVIGGLDEGWTGEVEVAGQRLDELTDRELARFRRRTVGFVFQAYHLLEHLSCAENVALASRFGGGDDGRHRSHEVLDLVGLASAAERRPTRLSGGERQRVALARALFNRPRLLLLDEPTGNLDTATGTEIIELLAGLHADLGLTVLAATHDDAIEAAGGRRIRMAGGALSKVER